MKHIEDGGDLRMFVNNRGELAVVCVKCGKAWVLQLAAAADVAGKRISRGLGLSIERDPNALSEAGLSPSEVINFLLDASVEE